MKKYIVLFLIASLVFGMSVSALAQEGIEESAKFMETLVSQIKTMLNANNVMGTGIEYEGTKIIPIVSYGFGFGGGSGTGGDEGGQGAGAGGGGGGGIMPVSLLVITKDGEVKVIAAKKGEFGEIMKAVAPMIVEAIKSGQLQQQQTPPDEEEAEQSAQQ
jgi:uncharacterized spore protein YtfJ